MSDQVYADFPLRVVLPQGAPEPNWDNPELGMRSSAIWDPRNDTIQVATTTLGELNE